MKIFDNLVAIVKSDTPIADLQAQLEGSQEALNGALAAELKTQAAFDAEASKATEKALATQQDAVRLARNYVARAERLLAAGEKRDSDKEHLDRLTEQARLTKLHAKLTLRSKTEAVDREVSSYREVAAARQARRELDDELVQIEREQYVLHIAMGGEPKESHYRRFGTDSGSPVTKLLQDEVAKHEHGTHLNTIFRDLASSVPR